MSRRSQTRRRRTYGRRQHEVRERRPDSHPDGGWLGDSDVVFESDWQGTDGLDERAPYGDAYGGYGR